MSIYLVLLRLRIKLAALVGLCGRVHVEVLVRVLLRTVAAVVHYVHGRVMISVERLVVVVAAVLAVGVGVTVLVKL